MHRLDQFIRSRNSDPRGFDDVNVNDKYRSLLSATSKLCGTISKHMWYAESGERLQIPSEWKEADHERYYAAVDDLDQARDKCLLAYDEFLRAAQIAHLERVSYGCVLT